MCSGRLFTCSLLRVHLLMVTCCPLHCRYSSCYPRWQQQRGARMLKGKEAQSMAAAAAVEGHQPVGRQQYLREGVVVLHLQRQPLQQQQLLLLLTAVLCKWHQKMLRHGRGCSSSSKDDKAVAT